MGSEQDEKLKGELRSVLGQQKEWIEQSHDATSKRLRAVEEAFQADAMHKDKLSADVGQVRLLDDV